MAHSTTMTVRLPDTTFSRLDKLAKATERTKAFLASKAIEEYIDNQEWQVQAIKEAVQEADMPGATFYGHDEIVKKVQGMVNLQKRRGSK